MDLSNLTPATGSVKKGKRIGRGQGSGRGGTSTRGHNGQKSRSGYSRKKGFEGGQMPLQMRLPKYGFSSRIGRVSAEVRTSELNKLDAKVITIEVLRKANLVTAGIKRAKVMLSGDVTKAVTLEGIGATKGARAAIEAAGGKVIDIETPIKVKKLAKKAEKPAAVAKKKPAKTKKDDAPAAEE